LRFLIPEVWVDILKRTSQVIFFPVSWDSRYPKTLVPSGNSARFRIGGRQAVVNIRAFVVS